MADLKCDTELVETPDGFIAKLSEDWAGIGSPNGGYLAAIALRAAGREARGFRPTSFSCQFLAPPSFGGVTVAVSPLKQSRRAAAVRVDMSQDGRLVLAAVVWAVTLEGDGFQIDSPPVPDVPGPDMLVSFEEAVPDAEAPGAPVWSHVDNRPTEHWQSPSSTAPKLPLDRSWNRFPKEGTYPDPFLDAGRLLIVADTVAFWPMARMFGPEFTRLPYFAPNIDLNLQLHGPSSGDDWLLVESVGESAAHGTVASVIRIWGESGRLLGTGTSTMVCRPNPMHESP